MGNDDFRWPDDLGEITMPIYLALVDLILDGQPHDRHATIDSLTATTSANPSTIETVINEAVQFGLIARTRKSKTTVIYRLTELGRRFLKATEPA